MLVPLGRMMVRLSKRKTVRQSAPKYTESWKHGSSAFRRQQSSFHFLPFPWIGLVESATRPGTVLVGSGDTAGWRMPVNRPLWLTLTPLAASIDRISARYQPPSWRACGGSVGRVRVNHDGRLTGIRQPAVSPDPTRTLPGRVADSTSLIQGKGRKWKLDCWRLKVLLPCFQLSVYFGADCLTYN